MKLQIKNISLERKLEGNLLQKKQLVIKVLFWLFQLKCHPDKTLAKQLLVDNCSAILLFIWVGWIFVVVVVLRDNSVWLKRLSTVFH